MHVHLCKYTQNTRFQEYVLPARPWAGREGRVERKRQRVAALSLFSDDFHGDLLVRGSGGVLQPCVSHGQCVLSADYLAHVLRATRTSMVQPALGIHRRISTCSGLETRLVTMYLTSSSMRKNRAPVSKGFLSSGLAPAVLPCRICNRYHGRTRRYLSVDHAGLLEQLLTVSEG